MNSFEEEDLDLTKTIKIIWKRRKLIIITVATCLLLGLIFSLLSPDEYASKTVILREVSPNSAGRGFSRLANLAGISSAGLTSTGEMSPAVYPDILNSRPFQEEALAIIVNSKKYGDGIVLRDYLLKTDEDNLLKALRRYTIGLPFKILRSFRSSSADRGKNQLSVETESFIKLSPSEVVASSLLAKAITIDTDQTTGAITIECFLNEPEPSAILTDHVKKKLEAFVRDYKTQKIKQEVEFMQNLHDEKKREYEKAQQALATYKDSNRIVSSSSGLTEEQSLNDSYRLAYSLYNQIAAQLENKKIELQEVKPVFTTIQPVILPRKPASPNIIKSLFLSVFIGFFLGFCLLFAIESKLYIQSKW
ncbi:MAG: Wzz/FepE/Etk N-terminal domain-containing protein [Cytophagales bacterium]|nr:Wzz/FepE/Etk N-terminal domain-containing protein [Cytophagales bacterium]